MKFALPLLIIAAILLQCPGCSKDESRKENYEYLSIDLPQIRRKNQRLYHFEQKEDSEGRVKAVYIFSDMQTLEGAYAEIYMIVEVEKELLTYKLGAWDTAVISNGDIMLSDLNGDSVDEIILQMQVTGNGGTLAQIFKVEGEKIVLTEDLNEMNYSFSTKFLPGKFLSISKAEIGFSQILDISSEYDPSFFDLEGKAQGEPTVFFGPIESCYVEKQNGVTEIYCSQSVEIVNRLGNLQTVFRYDQSIAGFKMTQAFIACQGDGSLIDTD